MPNSKEESKLKKHTLLLFEGDYERANSIYPETPAAEVIRNLLHKFLNDIETKKTRLPKTEGVNL